VGQTGLLNFVPLGTTQMSEGDTIDLERFPPLFPGSEVSSASIGQNQQSGLTVNFQLKDNGAKLFGDYTRDHVGEYFAIVLDGKIVSAPRINSSIPGGQVQIEAGGAGGFPLREATNLVTILKFGSLPFPIQKVSDEQISATLGSEFLRQSLLAGAIGILLVLVFMLVHYRLPGLVAGFALAACGSFGSGEVNVFPVGGETWRAHPGERIRIKAVEVEGKTVTMMLSAETAAASSVEELERFFELADRLLANVRF